MEIDLENEEIWEDLIDSLFEIGEIEEALQFTEQAIEKFPHNYQLHFRHIALLIENNSIKDAEIHLIALLSIDSNYVNEMLNYYPQLLDYPIFVEIIENFRNT